MLSSFQPALRRARAFFRRRVTDGDMADELQMHVDALAERNRAAGMSAIEARTAALREFGGVEQIKERCRDERLRGLTWLYQLSQDVRYGLRQMRHAPGFTAVAVLSLGVALGVNTAIFSLVDAVLLKTLPVRDPQQIALLTWKAKSWPAPFNQTGGDSRFSFSYPAFERLRNVDPTSADLFAFVPLGFGPDNATLVINGEPQFAQALMVSSNFFRALGAEPTVGRGFTDADDVRGHANVVVLSDSFWKRRFNRNPDAIGQSITINDTPFTIVGVAPPKFYGITPTSSPVRPDLWIPFSDQPSLRPWGMAPPGSPSVFTANNWINLNVGARIAASADRAATQARLENTFKAFVRENWIQAKPDDLPRLQLFEATTAMAGLRDFTLKPLLVLMGAVALVLVIACANLAGLLLARAAARQKEISVRAAMGATRSRILRQLLTESLLLSLIGGAAGLLFALWGNHLLATMISPEAEERMAFDVVIDAPVFCFTALASLATGVVFGLVPAWRGSRGDLMGAMKQRGSTGEDRSSHRLGKWLVAVQLAVSLVMMISAGLFARTLHAMENRDLGFDSEHLLLFGLDPTRQGTRGDALLTTYEQIRQRIAALPGIESVTLYEQMPFTGSNNSNFSIEGSKHSPGNPIARWAKVGPNFCRTMKLRLIMGRDIVEEDRRGTTRVAVVDESFVRTFLGDEPPLGRRFFGAERDVPMEIVGVVWDTELTELHGEKRPQVFIPYLQAPVGNLNTMYFEVRTQGEPLARAAEIRQVVAAEAPRTPLIGLTTQTKNTAGAMAQERMFARLASIFSAATLILSCIGLYGTIAYQVNRRVPELGVRIALGATPQRLMKMVISQGLRLVLVGIVTGLLLSLGATRTLRGMLYGISTSDPVTFLLAAAVMTGVAVLACWIPARRAAKVDPLTSLRAE